MARIGHVVQSAAADDAYLNVVHALSSSQPPASSWWLFFDPFHVRLAVRFADVSRGNRRVVLEKYQILAFHGLAEELPFERQRLHRVKAASHDPGCVDVRGGGDEAWRVDRGAAARFEVHDLMTARVAACPPDPHARHDGLVAAREIDHARLLERHEIIRHVTCAVELVRARGIFPLPLVHHIAGVRKTRPQRAVRVAHGKASRVVEMQVRSEHDLDGIGRHARPRQRQVEMLRPIERVDAGVLRVHGVADARVDDHQPLTSNEQRPHREGNPVPLVGWRALLPQRFRNDPEHRAAVQAEVPVQQRREFQLAERHACFSSTSTPWALVGWMNSTRDPWAPGRGVSSINRTPRSFRRASAARISSTRSVMWCSPGPRFATYFAIGESSAVASSSSSADSPAGMKWALTFWDATSSGASISSPSASR